MRFQLLDSHCSEANNVKRLMNQMNHLIVVSGEPREL